MTPPAPAPPLQTLLAQVNEAMAQADAALRRGDLEALNRALEAALEWLAQLTRAGHRPRIASAAPEPWDEAQVTHTLWLVLAQLKRAGCSAFPFAGTLLGLERDGRLLAGDKDIDLALWLEDFQLACRTLAAIGFIRAPNSPPFGNVATFALLQPRLSLDLFGIRREPEHERLVGGAWLYGRPPSHQRIVHYPAFELASRTGPAGEVWWPQPADRLLTALYGDWRTPRPEWDSLISCRALQETNLQWRCWALKRLGDQWLTSDPARTRRLLATIVERGGADPLLLRCGEALDAAVLRTGVAVAANP